MKRSTRFGAIALLASWMLRVDVFAKRDPPPDVRPVERNGVIYSAPWVLINEKTDGVHYSQSCGYVLAREAKTQKIKWMVQVYFIDYDRSTEADVQDIWITSLAFDHGDLVVRDEKRRTFRLDPTTLKVTRL